MSDDSEDKPYSALREAEDLAKLENTPFPHQLIECVTVLSASGLLLTVQVAKQQAYTSN